MNHGDCDAAVADLKYQVRLEPFVLSLPIPLPPTNHIYQPGFCQKSIITNNC